VEGKFQIFLILLAVLAGAALLARRINVAPAILLLLSGIALAFVPGMPSLELPPELVEMADEKARQPVSVDSGKGRFDAMREALG